MTRIAVTGVGAVSPLGLDAPSTWRAAVAGESGIDWISAFDAEGLPIRIAARDQGLRPLDGRLAEGGAQARALRPDLAFGRARRRSTTPASRTSTRPASGSSSARRSAASRGSPSRPTRSASAAPTASRRTSCRTSSSTRASGQLAISLGITGLNYAIVSACATGSHAIGEAAELIKRGDADAVIAGGIESCIDPLILAGFTAMRGLAAEDEYPPRASRPFDATRAGFVIGGGRRRGPARALGPRRGARRRDLRRGARLRRLERRAPPRPARAGGASASRR